MFVTLVGALVAIAAAAWSFHRPPTLRVDVVPRPSAPRRSGRSAVSVIVPARNEATNLPRLLDSLAACLGPSDELIVVDDASHDDTALVAARHGATVISAPALPAGWVGKNWACHIGAARARSGSLLFLDADTWLAAGALDALLAAHGRVGGLVSVQPHHHVRRLTERLSAVFNLVSIMGSGGFGWRRPPVSAGIAFGPCLLTTTADYQHAGGHAAVRAEVVEDIALAQRYGESGLPVTCLLGGDEVSFRMYPDGLRALIQGWSKNIALGAARAPLARVLPAVAWVIAVAAVTTSFALGLAEWAVGGRAPVFTMVAWTLVTAQLALMLRRLGTFGWPTAVFVALPLLFFVAVFARSAVFAAAHRPVTWRGRAVVAPADRTG